MVSYSGLIPLTRGGGWGEIVISYIDYIGMCDAKGYGFEPFWSEIEYRFDPFWF